MKVTHLFLLAAGLGLMGIRVPLSAHHAFAAEYDRDKPLTVTGTVSRLEWTNPHARIKLDAKDANGQVVRWDFELGPPNGLMRQGWSRNSLQPGHMVTIEGFRSKTEPYVANARTVKLADGRRVFAGSSFDTGPVQEQ